MTNVSHRQAFFISFMCILPKFALFCFVFVILFLFLGQSSKLQRKNKEFSFAPLSGFFLLIFLYLHGPFIIINEPLWIQCYTKAISPSDYFSFYLISSFCSTIPFRRLHQIQPTGLIRYLQQRQFRLFYNLEN